MLGLFKKKKEDSNESKMPKKDSKNKAEYNNEKINKKENIRTKDAKKVSKSIALKRNDDSSKKQVVEFKKPDIEKKKTQEDNTPLTNYQLVMHAPKSDLSLPLVTKQAKFIRVMQKRLLKVTALKGFYQEEFEKLYKLAYVINQSKRTPKWMKFYDLLFIGEGHAVIISKFNTSAGPLLSIAEVMESTLKLNSLSAIFFKLEFIINQMIKMYNEGKNRNYHFKDSIRELKTLGLATKELYEKLLFIAEIKSKVGRAWDVIEVKYQNPEGKVIKLKDKEVEFKALLSEVYVDIVELYVKVQEPYLHKFFLLWKDRDLAINNADSFYYI